MVTTKSSPSVAARFSGPGGKTKLQDALVRQPLVGGDNILARKLADKVKLLNFTPAQAITKQGDSDNDIYFILSGSVSIRVNEREVAIRRAGEHVGEMALVDSTSSRSATIIAIEESVLAKLCESQFDRLARSNNQLWRNLAVCIAQRLRERNKFHTPPRTKPVIFIASSAEGIATAECIHRYLSNKPCVPTLWSEGVFEASQTTVEDLVKQANESDFAIIVLTPDDMTASRKKKAPSPRDNTIFELGLFMGRIGRNRTYIVCPKGIDIKIPTDLLGLNRLLYDASGPDSLTTRLKSVKTSLAGLISKYGPL